jgi:hypothetical protein
VGSCTSMRNDSISINGICFRYGNQCCS